MWFLVYRIIDYVISPNHLHIVNVLGTVSIELMYHVWVACTYIFIWTSHIYMYMYTCGWHVTQCVCAQWWYHVCVSVFVCWCVSVFVCVCVCRM